MSARLVLALGALVAAATAQSPAPAAAPAPPACCCCAAEKTPLPPLPADATDKERWLRRIHDEAPDDGKNVYLSTRYLDGFRARLAALKEGAPLVEQFSLRWALAEGLLRTGELDEAAGLCRQCVTLCEQNPGQAGGWLPDVLLRLGAIHFRQAEKQNCISRHNAESCILPLSERAVHVDKEGAAAAAEVLTRLLAL